MAKIKLVRVDSRLLHASIVIYWHQYVNAGTIVVVDSEIAKDPFYQKILALSVPSYLKIRVFDEAGVLDYCNDEKYSEEKAILLVKNIEVIYRLIKQGAPIKAFQICRPVLNGIQNKKNGIAEYYGEKDKQYMQELLDAGVKICYQVRTDEEKIKITSKILKLK